jgi:hypothetical protein
MNQPETNDPLDALLHEQNQHVEDNGFTARVIVALPRQQSRFPLRQIFLLCVTAVGSALAILWLPWENLPVLNFPALLSLNTQVLMPWVLVLSVMASLVWATVTAVQWED